MYALYLDAKNVVFEVTEENPEGRFHADIRFLPCPDEARPGWRVENGGLVPPPAPPEPTPEERQAAFVAAIQTHLDGFAQSRNYDNILSATTYATSTVPKFRAEGQYAVEARDATWAKGYEILGEVMSGARPMPTLEEVIAELPALAWPEEQA